MEAVFSSDFVVELCEDCAEESSPSHFCDACRDAFEAAQLDANVERVD